LAVHHVGGMLKAMPSHDEQPPVETWWPKRDRWWWAIPAVIFWAVWFSFVGGALIDAVRDDDLGAAGLLGIMCLFAVVIVAQPFRYYTSRLEIREDGLTVVSLGRRRCIPWSNIARVETDYFDFVFVRRRGPCVVLVLTDRRRVRLLVTEQFAWRYDERSEAVERRAEQLRSIRRKYQPASN
jgi:hypothetical protein